VIEPDDLRLLCRRERVHHATGGHRTINRLHNVRTGEFGAIISRHAPDLVELFGAIGYDFVMIDGEHGSMSLDEVEHMVRAAEAFGIRPIARIPNHEDSTILRFLDRGVQGIIVPHVNTSRLPSRPPRSARQSERTTRRTSPGSGRT
jgi:2-keto-3-deoxy-L-rhamnonate aldolase RhmA